MRTFFEKSEVQQSINSKYTCNTCGLLRFCNTPKMQPQGLFKKKILIIGEYPEEADDVQGKPFMGKQGRMLRRELKKQDIDVDKDCLSTFALKCRPNKPPKKHQVIACRRYILRVIKKHNPHVIILIGKLGIESLIAHEWKKDLGSIEKWRGWQIPSQMHNAWICPIYAPKFVAMGEPQVKTVWLQDIAKMAVLVHNKMPVPLYKEPTIEIIDDLSILETIDNDAMVAIDYETTGIKPHCKGHKILAISVATSPDHAYVFSEQDRKKLYPYTDLLKNRSIGKIAHNYKFEDHWTVEILKTVTKNWVFDTQLAAHILDNRPGVTSLKFQTYVLLGIGDYDSLMQPYITAEDSNSFNRFEEYMKTPTGYTNVLTYCGKDTINTYRIAKIMEQQMGMDLFINELPF